MKYICPSCKNTQDSAIHVEDVTCYYKFKLKRNTEAEKVDEEGGEHIRWICPECNEELPEKITKRIEKILRWR